MPKQTLFVLHVWINKLTLKHNTFSCCFTLFICGGPCLLSSLNKCSRDLISDSLFHIIYSFILSIVKFWLWISPPKLRSAPLTQTIHSTLPSNKCNQWLKWSPSLLFWPLDIHSLVVIMNRRYSAQCAAVYCKLFILYEEVKWTLHCSSYVNPPTLCVSDNMHLSRRKCLLCILVARPGQRGFGVIGHPMLARENSMSPEGRNKCLLLLNIYNQLFSVELWGVKARRRRDLPKSDHLADLAVTPVSIVLSHACVKGAFIFAFWCPISGTRHFHILAQLGIILGSD